jgi:hypothetical protein
LGGFHTISLIVDGPEKAVRAGLEKLTGVKEIKSMETSNTNGAGFSLKTTDPENVVKQISKLTLENNWGTLQLFKEQRNLEDIFHEILSGGK